MNNNLVIKFSKGFDYHPINALENCDWIYNNEWFDFDNQGKLELLIKLRDNNLIKGNYVHIPKGEYQVVDMDENEWIFNVGNFTLGIVPFFDKYALVYQKK